MISFEDLLLNDRMKQNPQYWRIVNIFQGVPLPPITAAVTSVAAIKLSAKKGDRKVLYYS